MANNRMFLRCKNCGSKVFLGKCFGGAYTTWIDRDKFIDNLNDFYEEHCFCNKELNEDDINYLEPKFEKESRHYENCFEVAYEIYHDDYNESEMK